MSDRIATHEGRVLFGSDPRTYDAIRPPYPEQIYIFLCATGALHPNVSTLEIGAGTGLATRRLLELGADPLTIIEPDARFAPWLTSLVDAYEARVHYIAQPFEPVDLPARHYDLVAAATSFHWLEPRAALTKIAQALQPGGYVALWWHVFGDPQRDDPFHEATRTILESLASSPSDAPDAIPFALDIDARCADFASVGQFEPPRCEMHRWELTLGTAQVGALYSTFSGIARLPESERRKIIERLMEVADQEFGGTVTRNMVAPIYLARRTT